MNDNKVVFVGIGHKAGHGKDSVANVLLREFYGTRVYFADELKKAVKSLFVLEDRNMWDQNGKDEPIDHLGGVTGRHILQQFGTNVARCVYSNIWVFKYEMLLKKLLKNADRNIIIVTPDVRFENEAECIRELKEKYLHMDAKSVLVKVVRPGHEANGNPAHPSETALDDYDKWDHIIVANSMAKLEYGVQPVAEVIKQHFTK